MDSSNLRLLEPLTDFGTSLQKLFCSLNFDIVVEPVALAECLNRRLQASLGPFGAVQHNYVTKQLHFID